MNKIGEVIYEKGYRKNYIAEKIGVLPAQLSHYIRGTRKPNKEKLNLLCHFLDCKVRDLFPLGVED
jgi:transcriptional regulator with XRE-family HTH domain|tara:strand:- start:314 stop:511 length:198 start_codon:yes stop_codon:yes gene_type:complete